VRSSAAADHCNVESLFPQEPHSEPVAHVEAFQDLALWTVKQGAVGEHPVYVQNDQADALRPLQNTELYVFEH
jgi:hypothetical protein